MEYEPIQLLQGVRWGCPLSSTRFVIYVNKMVQTLAKTGVGVYAADTLVAAILYADGVTIWALNVSDFQKRLNADESFCIYSHMSSNVGKSTYIICKRKGHGKQLKILELSDDDDKTTIEREQAKTKAMCVVIHNDSNAQFIGNPDFAARTQS